MAVTRLALLLALLLTSCANPCADIEQQLAAIKECKNFVIYDWHGCRYATQEYINERCCEQLNCGAFYTEPNGIIWTVTMGEVQP